MVVPLSIVGRKGSGKSKILGSLIELLTKRGHRVGVIKHLARDEIEIDQSGTDTFNYRMQGAQTVVLSGRKRLALFSNVQEEISLASLLKFFDGFDLVFLEGYFSGDVPIIEVQTGESSEGLLTARMKNVFAICSNQETSLNIPRFDFDQVDLLVSLIEEKFLIPSVSLLTLASPARGLRKACPTRGEGDFSHSHRDEGFMK